MNDLHPTFLKHPKLHEAYTFGLDHPATHAITTADQLIDEWQYEYDNVSMRPVPGLFGVMRHIHGSDHPDTLLSVDVDDVLRDSNATFLALGDYSTEEHAGEDYVTCFGGPFDIGYDFDIVGPAIRGLVLMEKIPPVRKISRIAQHLQYLREHGVYVVASTSTVPGTERATIQFLKKYLPESFDGIVFPGNHDNKGPITKGTVKKMVRQELHQLAGETTIRSTSMVDDAPHHILHGREAAAEMGIDSHIDATPDYPWNRHDARLNIHPTPVDAFEAIVEHFDDHRRRT